MTHPAVPATDPRSRSFSGTGSWPLTLYLRSFLPRLIGIVIVVFVFEEALYGRLALGTAPYLIAKTSSEALLYLVLVLVVLQRMLRGDLLKYRPTTFDVCVAAFLVLAAVSTRMNSGSLFQGLLNVRTMLRYLSIYYIIVLWGWVPTDQQILRFVKLLVSIAIVQVVFIVLQHVAGDAFRDHYFSPPQVEVEVSGMSKIIGTSETKLGSGYGTMGKTALAAFFLHLVAVTAAAVALSGRTTKNAGWWFAYIIMLMGIYFTYKRAALLLTAASPFLVAWIMGRKKFALRYLFIWLVAAPALVLLLYMIQPSDYVKEKKEEISPAESISQLLSDDYWAIAATKTRGWMIMEVGRQALVSFKPVGYGADEEHAKGVLAAKGGEFSKLVGWGAFDDVYIIAGLVYYGPVGVGLLLLAFHDVYRRGRHLAHAEHPGFRIAGASIAALLFVVLLSVFISRVLEFRAFAFSLWVLAGITVVATRKPAALRRATGEKKEQDR